MSDLSKWSQKLSYFKCLTTFTMGKRKMSQPLRKVSPRVSKKGKAKRSVTPRNCPKCLEKHEPPTGKRCQRLQTPGVRVGPDPLPGPPGLFASSSSAETLSADDIRLAPVRFLSVSSTDESTPPRQPEDGMIFTAGAPGTDDAEDYPTVPDYDDGHERASRGSTASNRMSGMTSSRRVNLRVRRRTSHRRGRCSTGSPSLTV